MKGKEGNTSLKARLNRLSLDRKENELNFFTRAEEPEGDTIIDPKKKP